MGNSLSRHAMRLGRGCGARGPGTDFPSSARVGSGLDCPPCSSVQRMVEPEIRPAKLDELPGVLALYRQLNPGDPGLDLAAAGAVWSACVRLHYDLRGGHGGPAG